MATPNQIGDWSGLFDWPLIGLHSILTPDGKVLTFGTDGAGVQGGQVIYDVWDPVTNVHFTLPNITQTDIFCSYPIIVPDTGGQIMISGGDARPLGLTNHGIHDSEIYDYQTMTLTPCEPCSLNFSRWYPSEITLGNGQIVIMGGVDHDADFVGYSEIYTPGVGWQVLPESYIAGFSNFSYYPRTWVDPRGEIIAFAPSGEPTIYSMDPHALGAVKVVGSTPDFFGWEMPSIMFAENKVLLIANDGKAWIMDIGGAVPTFQSADPGPGLASLTENRAWANMTLLADGTVFLSGGGGDPANTLTDVNTTAAIWNPATGVWSAVDGEATARLYHSTAILLPDATVLSLGGGAPGPLTNLNGEIYRPAYLYDASGQLAERPVITEAPQQVLHAGDAFDVSVTTPDPIQSLSLIAFESVTHSTDFTAKHFSLDFTQQPDGSLHVTLPDNVNTLTPGYWMLFAIDSDGTPSVAATIQIAAEGVDIVSDLPPPDFGAGAGDGLFATAGTAFSDAWNGGFHITPDASNERGDVMSTERVDLRQAFTMGFDLNFGTKDNGGEGMAFVLHNDPRGKFADHGEHQSSTRRREVDVFADGGKTDFLHHPSVGVPGAVLRRFAPNDRGYERQRGRIAGLRPSGDASIRATLDAV